MIRKRYLVITDGMGDDINVVFQRDRNFRGSEYAEAVGNLLKGEVLNISEDVREFVVRID
jgi:hypothetical protein